LKGENIMPDLADVAVKVAERAFSSAVGTVGGIATKIKFVLKIVDSQVEKVIRDKAREILGCQHIIVCPNGTFNTRQTDMIDYVQETGGMAFVYEGVALGHSQRSFDVKRISTQVFRATYDYDKVNKKYGYTDDPRANTSTLCDQCLWEK
jgi:hypothetical protein